MQANLDDCLKSSPSPEDSTPDLSKAAEDANAEEQQEEEQGDDGTTFHNVWMLGCLGIRVPKDEDTIQNQIAQLNSDEQVHKITLYCNLQ